MKISRPDEEHQRQKYDERPLFESPNALLSVSIDIVGSTQAKTDVLKFQDSVGQNPQQFEAFMRTAAAIELDFFTALQRLQVLRLEDVFVVKNLGDEIWCVVPIDTRLPTLAQLVAHDLISALQATFFRKVDLSFAIAEKEEDPRDVDSWSDIGQFLNIPLSVKATVDVLTEVTEFTDFRRKFLMERLAVPYRRDHRAVARLFEQLNCGSTEVVARSKIRFSLRSDYIGAHVDRFFRLAGKALPGLIVVGDDAYGVLAYGGRLDSFAAGQNHVGHYLLPVDGRDFFIENRAAGAKEHGSSRARFISWLRREAPNFKGVLEGYGLRYCYDEFTMRTIERNQKLPIFSETRKKLIDSGDTKFCAQEI